jgi:hypothetical protein
VAWVGRPVGDGLAAGRLWVVDGDGAGPTPQAASPVATEPAANPRRSVRREIPARIDIERTIAGGRIRGPAPEGVGSGCLWPNRPPTPEDAGTGMPGVTQVISPPISQRGRPPNLALGVVLAVHHEVNIGNVRLTRTPGSTEWAAGRRRPVPRGSEIGVERVAGRRVTSTVSGPEPLLSLSG